MRIKMNTNINKGLSLYEQLLQVVSRDKIATYRSDIYVIATKETKKIIDEYLKDIGLTNTVSEVKIFKDNIDGEKWYELPFAYMSEYIESRRKKEK
jgi:hypothetical protein